MAFLGIKKILNRITGGMAKSLISLIILIAASTILQSCVVAVSSTIVVSSYVIARDKEVSQSYSDLKIFLAAKNKFLSSDYRSVFHSVDLKVHNGAVYLIGRVRDDNTRIFIIDEVRKIEGVKKIYDEIIVDAKTSLTRAFFINIKDSFLTAKTKLVLALSPDIHSINYSIESINGTVYVIGNATNMMEAEKVSLIIAKGFIVKKVVNYAVVEN